jgi:Dockerin type I domain
MQFNLSKTRSLIAIVLATSGLAATSTPAAIVHVHATGPIDYNQFINGPLHGIPAGTPCTMDFDVDSDVYVNSPTYPTRGYPINQSSFVIMVGSVPVGLASPFPAGQTPYFVIRNNDPAVDGFFIATNTDFLSGVPLNTSNINLHFLRTFTVGTMWPSVNILDALGSYGFEFMSSYEWTFNVGPGTPLEIAYQTISLTLVQPCPADVNGSHSVDIDDLLGVINAWGTCATPPCPADVNHSGAIDIDDLLAVINGWGPCP